MLSSSVIQISFPDGSTREFPQGVTAMAVAESISRGLAKNAVAALIDGVATDLSTPMTQDAALQILTFSDPKGVEIFRHSSAHLLAQAVLELFPNAKPTIGPAVDEGFYYDFDHPPFTTEELEQIERRMEELAKKDQVVERLVLTKAEAAEMFKDNPFKLEMIQEIEGETLTAYRQGNFVDLCRGPHLPRTGMIRAMKILKVGGSYWRADATKAALQRIYAITFPDKKLLQEHLDILEQARARDHRKIGKELELFAFHEEGPGFPFWLPNGMALREQVVTYWREVHRKHGYVEISTPMMLDESLWHRSGHWDHYAQNMYFTKIDDRPFAVKPMNCPGGLLVFTAKRRSYRDLPMRVAELGLVHRHELSGVLHGLFRVRCFTQDDAHIYCAEESLTDEISGVVKLVFEIYKTFGFDQVHVELSTRPASRLGDEAIWDRAEGALKDALQSLGIEYQLNPGDGAFYGPKIDFHVRDCMKRSWQCGTIQVDFSMPSEQRFNATYEGADGKRHQPVMVHRAILGSLERFIGILLENTAGKLPLWLSPRQMRVMPISLENLPYAEQVVQELRDAGFRVELDERNETVSKKVREAQLDRVNYQLVVGQREADSHAVAVRTRGNRQLGAMPVPEFIEMCKKEIAERAITGE